MFYLRAVEKDNKSTTPGVRKYYSADKFSRLFDRKLMDNLSIILNVWKVVNRHEVIDDEPWTKNSSILKRLDTLNSYPNEFWKYPIIIYYLSHRKGGQFRCNLN